MSQTKSLNLDQGRLAYIHS